MKRTRQGVRDLNDIPAKKNTQKLDAQPKNVSFCRHPANAIGRHTSGDTFCHLCGQMWDWNGMPY